MVGKLETVLERKMMALNRISTVELRRRSSKSLKHMKPVNDAAAQAVRILKTCSSPHLTRMCTLLMMVSCHLESEGWLEVRDRFQFYNLKFDPVDTESTGDQRNRCDDPLASYKNRVWIWHECRGEENDKQSQFRRSLSRPHA